ncbi:glycosyl hydrolase family 3 [Mesobacillus maritimus]|uniref:glycoside hydrolase family 3 protein n=1 Tax=Mesobacillus maritimus TaxID=1643336 RepID=UPI00203EBD20|nr:glycoside hydrolase family 3 N-terminal domain-containing protein [Mesobacillus maritimus]MCM3586598.1 glycosyl hydrolase family 3 [Mesobacillus maritimus]
MVRVMETNIVTNRCWAIAVVTLGVMFLLVFVGCSRTDLSTTLEEKEEIQVKSDFTESVEGPKDIQNEEREASSEVEEQPVDSAFLQIEHDVQQQVEKLIASMTLEEKIGQMIVVGFSSKAIDSHIKAMIQEYKAGGVILYDRNMDSPKQVKELTDSLQWLARGNEHKIPLMISIDQEGGQIVRMRDKVAKKPSQKELGIRGDDVVIYETNLQTGKELMEMGIQVNHAPVLDLSATDSRSYGEDPMQASEYGKLAVQGLNDAGVTATLKHFPGNGRSEVDPHYEASSVEANQLDLENQDILPFKEIMDGIDHQNFFVMVTHLKYPAYDDEHPASISPIIIQELLRGKLQYEGLVVTDDLEMGAVNKYFTYKDLGYSAVDAGNDLLLVCHTFDSQKQVIQGIQEAVENKQLSEERIDESVRRILLYKLNHMNGGNKQEH